MLRRAASHRIAAHRIPLTVLFLFPPRRRCADALPTVTVTIAQQEGVGTVNGAPALGDEVKDARTLAREKKLAEKQKSVEEYRATQAEIEKV